MSVQLQLIGINHANCMHFKMDCLATALCRGPGVELLAKSKTDGLKSAQNWASLDSGDCCTSCLLTAPRPMGRWVPTWTNQEWQHPDTNSKITIKLQKAQAAESRAGGFSLLTTLLLSWIPCTQADHVRPTTLT